MSQRKFTAFASAARTATPTAFDGVADEAVKGMIVIIDVTVDPAAASVVFTVSGRDPASDKLYTLLVSAAIVATGTTVLRIGPELTASANVVAKDFIPAHWTIAPVHADTDSITYSVGVNLVS